MTSDMSEALEVACSLLAFKRNIRKAWREGKRRKGQHVAIAISTLKKACGVPLYSRMRPAIIVAKGAGGAKPKPKSESRFVTLASVFDQG